MRFGGWGRKCLEDGHGVGCVGGACGCVGVGGVGVCGGCVWAVLGCLFEALRVSVGM